jgi:5-methylthioadenosine/S-adenosylhomocysteine deaminase
MTSTLICDGTLVTMNDRREVFRGDLRMTGSRIVEIGKKLDLKTDEQMVSAEGCFVIPGLVQAHTHLCQTLFRGLADDLELLDWLKKKIWPMEHAHNEESLRASAQIGLLEMQTMGTTSILDMGTTGLHDVVFEEAERSGIRYWGGNCLMDLKSASGPLYRATEDSLQYSEALLKKWHKKSPLLQYAISPRFAISCSDKILKAAAEMQKRYGVLLHTHASENKTEVTLVKKRTGLNNVQFLKKLGLLSERTVIAHGIHLTAGEITDMVKHKAGLCHCPSSNLKLASGVVRISLYLEKGMKVALGSDGAPCNNSMDPFMEMRLAALLQKPLVGPTALPALQAFELATLGGANVLNVENEIGSLAVGKRADLAIVRRDHPSVATVADPYSALVYSCSGRDVRDVWTDGRAVVRNGVHSVYDAGAVTAFAGLELAKLLKRM